MKKIKYIVLASMALLLSNCDTNDDGFYNTVYIDVPHLVTIDPHSSTYTVGEKLYVNADFSQYQDENGQDLDLFKTTGANTFTFSYVIEKQIDANNWEGVYVNDSQLDIIKGNAQNGSYVYGICEYNPDNKTYEYRVGFPLLTAGTYRMSFGYNSTTTNTVDLRSESPAGRLIVNITSLMGGIDASGYYNFTVN
jgi:hypothetical protein